MYKNLFSKRELIIFIVISIGFLMMPTMFMRDISSQQNFYQQPFFIRITLQSILLLIFFLFNYFILSSKLYFQKKYIIYFLTLIGSFFIIYKIPELVVKSERIQQLTANTTPLVRKAPPAYFVWAPRILMYLCMVLISLFLRHNKRYQEIKEEKQLSEIAYLRAQINPHFLFNTLNNIYALTLQKSDYASDAVMKLSKMMRFVVSESSKDNVPLLQDLDYIKNYIELQKLRFVNKNSVDFIIDGDPKQINISPLLLINFIENAFKYGVLDDVTHPIKVYITIDNKFLELYLENEIENIQFDNVESSEVGLINTYKRLEYLYTNRYDLKIHKDKNQYIVNLKLNLND